MRCISSIVGAFGLWIVLFSTPSSADLVSAANSVRTAGCAGKSSAAPALRRDKKLNGAAARLEHAGDLGAALRGAGYRALQSTSIHITNAENDQAIAQILARRFCKPLSNTAFRDIGTARRGAHTWIVLATPVPAVPANTAATSLHLLELVNEARSKERRCGREHFEPAPPLKLVPALSQAARAHAQDMAKHDTLNHQGSDGSTPADRAGRAGYRWRIVGENIASGRMTPDEVTAGWLQSPHHCENIMDPRFTDFGIAFAERREGDAGLYWVQVFAAPR